MLEIIKKKRIVLIKACFGCCCAIFHCFLKLTFSNNLWYANCNFYDFKCILKFTKKNRKKMFSIVAFYCCAIPYHFNCKQGSFVRYDLCVIFLFKCCFNENKLFFYLFQQQCTIQTTSRTIHRLLNFFLVNGFAIILWQR